MLPTRRGRVRPALARRARSRLEEHSRERRAVLSFERCAGLRLASGSKGRCGGPSDKGRSCQLQPPAPPPPRPRSRPGPGDAGAAPANADYARPRQRLDKPLDHRIAHVQEHDRDLGGRGLGGPCCLVLQGHDQVDAVTYEVARRDARGLFVGQVAPVQVYVLALLVPRRLSDSRTVFRDGGT
jgi:hypothetical protein